MATLEAIGSTVLGGGLAGVLAFLLFGIAVELQSPLIAPRATARPRTVIHNTRAPRGHVQYRGGNAIWGWIPWTLSLTYDTLLRGVPGTGTRDGGLAGPLLRCNLDGIVLLRFHALGMRVAALATWLCLLILLPVYYTAGCYEAPHRQGCQETGRGRNLTNYERTTLANVPADLFDGKSTSFVYSEQVAVRMRLYTTVIVFWILIAYTCYQLKREWIEMLAMRRVYYLETDVWGHHKEELEQSTKPCSASDVETFRKREPWIPHPEPLETVPNIALYSVLVGGLPSLPEQAGDNLRLFSKRESIDWQLELAATFFDHCVPNQPGFSSSVAAVTIIPSANKLATAWRKWYAAAAKLRRLTYIREIIAERRHYDIEIDDDSNHRIEPTQAADVTGQPSQQLQQQQYSGVLPDYHQPNRVLSPYCSTSQQKTEEALADGGSNIYLHPERYKSYYRAILGGGLGETEDNAHYVLGPAQAAVYSRELAQAAAPCGPRGCCESHLRNASIDELMELEEEAAADVHSANLELKAARQRATLAYDSDDSDGYLDPELALSGGARKDTDPLPIIDRQQPSSQHASSVSVDDSTLASLPAAPNVSPFPTPKKLKGHRRKPSLEGTKIPSNLKLEATLYSKATGVVAADNRSRLGSGGSGGNHQEAQSVPQVSNISVVSSLPSPPPMQNSSLTEWEQVEALVKETAKHSVRSSDRLRPVRVPTGQWDWPSMSSLWGRATKGLVKISAEQVEEIARDSTYAIVTFTSRQAAVAARQCLSDGRGADRWVALKHLPIPPLADAAAFDFIVCRNCCRPLALSVNERQKQLRNYCAIAMLAAIYTLYTVPLTFVSAKFSGDNLENLFPGLGEYDDQRGHGLAEHLSGLIVAGVWSTFFACCPILFKAIANFGSKATSVATAEFMALKYYWWFMTLTAFSGTIFAKILISGFNDGLAIGSEVRSVLRAIATTISSDVSVNWLSWTIFRLLVTLPYQYMLQINSFAFECIGFKCCSRLVRGGGPGGPAPYRIFVDSGVVFMCIMALAPASPLVAPAAYFYFMFCQPLLRRNLIFMYRPSYDGGGFRWPFVFDMCISGMLIGSLLLAAQLGLKEALTPGILAGLTFIPIFVFHREARKRYLQAFRDAALLQTSLLDGWNTEHNSFETREEFRRFLVDAHKAAYVPVCLAATDTEDYLTIEPAVVVPLECDEESDAGKETKDSVVECESLNPLTLLSNDRSLRSSSTDLSSSNRMIIRRGAVVRRSVNIMSSEKRRATLSHQVSTRESYFDSIDSLRDDDYLLHSPFERSRPSRSSFRDSTRIQSAPDKTA